MKLINQSCCLVAVGPMATQLIEYAGRNCYRSRDKIKEGSDKKFIEALISRGHEAPIEFSDITFEIVTSRAVLAEITRHRLASFCVESQRYVNYNGDITFVYPQWYYDDSIKEKEDMYKEWYNAMHKAEDYYTNLLRLGAKPEEAREVLPNSTACSIMMKANLREWRHFFKLRCAKDAYPQTRSIALSMLEVAKDAVPYVFDDLFAEFIEAKE